MKGRLLKRKKILFEGIIIFFEVASVEEKSVRAGHNSELRVSGTKVLRNRGISRENREIK